MTKKQINKYTKEILALEMICQNEESTDEQKAEAMTKMDKIMRVLLAMPGGMEVIFAIDEKIQKHFDNK